MRLALAALVALALPVPAWSLAAELSPPPRGAIALGGDSWLVPGAFNPGRSPDGNTIILKGPKGAILVDTGRTAGHAESIAEALHKLNLRPVAIINTHWHLDHVSGNLVLRAANPGIEVYGTSAIEGALTGFLADSAAAARVAISSGSMPTSALPDVQGDLDTIARGRELRPDVLIDENSSFVLAGRTLSLHVAERAVTARDLWIYDAAQRRAIVGDLVTGAVPFLDTACPEGWLDALGDVAAVGAKQVIPGHGTPMDRASFARWRTAFGDFIACARGKGALETCSAGWLAGAAEFIGTDGKRAKAMADYYGELVRSKKLDGYCRV
jgi:glyoxylase-like metal-dependent hydrolase (beta-lactamase superfamily II)